MKAIKRAIPADVEFAQHAGSIQTLEGVVRFDRGDAILSGIRGERWPVLRERFEASYQAISPLDMGQDGKYLKIPVVVDAQLLARDGEVGLGKLGTLHGQAGDWQITSPDGESWIVERSVFEASYVLLDESSTCTSPDRKPDA